MDIKVVEVKTKDFVFNDEPARVTIVKTGKRRSLISWCKDIIIVADITDIFNKEGSNFIFKRKVFLSELMYYEKIRNEYYKVLGEVISDSFDSLTGYWYTDTDIEQESFKLFNEALSNIKDLIEDEMEED